ncbi:MAG: single-stranded DNA-binding protein [Armatimonadota bacterium]|nr:single-stranded DNA-binding protein [Armatimonadota bacterium]
MMNVVVLIGRLTRDPELKYTTSGVAVATFTIAIDRPLNSQGVKEADFINIVTWRKTAEFAANYITKGRLVAVEGRLQIRSWVAQDGSKKWMTEVVANQLRLLEWPKDRPAGTEAGAPSDEAAPPAADVAAPPEDFDPFADE